MTPTTDFVWLIERGQSMKQVPTVWWTGADSGEMWTTDAHSAQQFPSKDSAQGYIGERSGRVGHEYPFGIAVEHGFSTTPDPDRTPTTAVGDLHAYFWLCLNDENAVPSDETLDSLILAIEAEARASLDVERLARALPQVMTQEECDEVYAVGTNPLDVPYEWFTTPRELATDILSALEEPTP